jgi:hypothetical protein
MPTPPSLLWNFEKQLDEWWVLPVGLDCLLSSASAFL